MTTTPSIWIRRAAAGDVPAIARIWHAGWKDAHLGHVPEGLLRHRSAEQHLARARQRLEQTWVGGAGDAIGGFIVIVDDELEQIYVDADARGTGLGKVLLQRAEAEIRGAGHPQAWLAVATGNHRAREFYARRGWRDAGAFTYMADTEDGPFPVPCHRFEITL